MWHELPEGNDFDRPIKVEAAIDPVSRRYQVAMNDEQLAELGKKLGTDLSTTVKYDDEGNIKPHPVYNNTMGWPVLHRNDMMLNTDKELEHLHYGILLASPFVASSKEAHDLGEKPLATHYVYSEEMQMEKRAKTIDLKRTAQQKALEMSREEKLQVLLLLTKQSWRDKSDQFINVKIDDLLESSPKDFVKYASMKKDELFSTALISECIYKGILTKAGEGILFGGERLGFDMEDSIKYLQDPVNQPLKLRLMELIS